MQVPMPKRWTRKHLPRCAKPPLTSSGLPTIDNIGWANGQDGFDNISLCGELDGEDEEGNSYRNLDEEDAALRGVKFT
ncbi:uncharacterized protein N7469_003262 [Penicillium citrinum]|uniref:Uncharacterized protein n=1 Tax=Penicillium citrinum TaxID=5077 RepID=A0A9W9TUA8_PENCI|nr:uncharacterized protein N7469_003262 [Penicillium citrinum]KAJ5241671.1 hypothetical protein N7469_003262 [Penicillium citrinum]